MAGDWIPVSKWLSRRREVIAISCATSRSRYEVVGILLDFWAWVDEESADGRLPGLTPASLTSIIGGTDGDFWTAVISAGWLINRSTSLEVPNFQRWLGNSAKNRLKQAERVRQHRVRQSNSEEVSDSNAYEGEPRNKRNSIPRALRKHVFSRDAFTCAYCGWKLNPGCKADRRGDLLSLDHILPESRGGATEASNLVTACIRCNLMKVNRTPNEAGLELLYLTESARNEIVTKDCYKNVTTEEKRREQRNTPPQPPRDAEPVGECENGKNPYRSSLPCDNPNLATIAAKIVKHYQAVVRPGHTERGGTRVVIEQLQRGRPEESLRRAAEGYAAWCKANSKEGQYCQSVYTFYSEGTCDQFLDYHPEKPSQHVAELLAKTKARRDEDDARIAQVEAERAARNGHAIARHIAGSIGVPVSKEERRA